ncbi:hypothetical protein LXM25_13700 [Dyadobacter sp. LJ53]|uniref:hypothetical protein n=1 Tax=Dyadobacter chenwenxiniae TaxID=2906456 RepID=UPI001F3F6526|nr:hypothetical protein [Dyadobacter chenwenxiniae]MCF0051122.1 hypothetical protein [Dyadobacter chenwenxiniae]
MKKLLCLIFLALAGLLLNCKKNAEVLVIAPNPEPEKANLTKAVEFLKGISVAGADKIVFDSVTNSYMVSLPDSYDENEAEITVSMQKDIVLWDNYKTGMTADSIIKYKYKGTSPLNFKVSDNPEKSWFIFNVYFNFSGTPEIELLSKEIPINSTGSTLPIRYLAKVGSIPAAPEQNGTMVRIINRKTGFITESSLQLENLYVNFNEAQNLITNDPLAIEIHLYNQNAVVFEGVKFTRGVPAFFVAPDYKFEYSRKDTIKVTGGFFLPNAKYSVTFSSDFLSAPVTKNVRYHDVSRLTLDNIPANLPEGPYLISFHENGKLLGKSAIYMSNLGPSAVTSIWTSKTNAIENIWKGELGGAVIRNVNAPSCNRGDVFFARTLPLVAGNLSNAKLPNLRLKRDGVTVELKASLQIFNWAIAGVSFAVGKYTIPANLAPGAYEVTSIHVVDGKESKPYWSKMEIR